MKPLFERLGSVQFFHHLVWQSAPKDVFTSAIDTKCALYLAEALFNDGYAESLRNLCDLTGITFYLTMINQWEKFDSVKLYRKNIQNTEQVKENRKKLKQKNIETQEAFVWQEGTSYKSGAFHSLDQEKNNVRFVYYVCLCIGFS